MIVGNVSLKRQGCFCRIEIGRSCKQNSHYCNGKFPTIANSYWRRLIQIIYPCSWDENGYKEEWRLLTMTELHNLRKLYFEEARVSPRYPGNRRTERTVRVYLWKGRLEWCPHGSMAEVEFPKLDPFKADIDTWLTEDKKAKRKQRHYSPADLWPAG